MSDKLKISVITVAFNAAATLETTIKSVISQQYDGEIEYIIIDGGSTDGTTDIIRQYQDKIAYWVSEPDYGLYHAMNKGLEKATGELIGTINADDYYYPGALQKVADAMRDKDLTQYIFWGDMVHGEALIPGWREWNLTRGAFAPHPSMFCPKAVYDRIGRYKLQYKILADYDFMYRAVHRFGINPVYLPEPVAFFRPGGLASQHIFRSYTEEMLIKIDNGQTIKKAFAVYILKLIKYNLSRIFGKA